MRSFSNGFSVFFGGCLCPDFGRNNINDITLFYKTVVLVGDEINNGKIYRVQIVYMLKS